ncbi:MAG: ATP-binding protein [Thermodesulfobacteriota bacterium]
MTKEELLKRLEDPEDSFIERKTQNVAKGKELRKTLVAFANSVPEGREAIIFIGIADDGEVLGVKGSDALQKTIREEAKRCYPEVNCIPEIVQAKGKQVLAVIIKPSEERPHFDGQAFVRIGSESVKASKEVYEDLIASRNDKARKILNHKGEVVTVEVMKMLGNAKSTGIKGYYKKHECRIKGCNAHTLRLFEESTGKHFSEPLENITISHDDEKHRMLLLVK